MKPEWTVAQARALRHEVTERFSRQHRLFVPWAEGPVRLGLKIANNYFGVPVFQRRLEQMSGRMNRNQDSAFDHYSPTASDVVASAYFKAGTNWVMHICHQICHRGDGEFEHIQDVIPWPDAAQPKFWINVNDPAPYQSSSGQRVIKSHLAADKMPINDQAKYIAVTRDPKDCAASGYHFFHSLIFGPTMPPASQWLAHFSSADAPFGLWESFTASWYKLREQPNVLFLRFEDMKAQPEKIIDDIAAFLGVELSNSERSNVIAKTSFDAMKLIDHKFYPANQSIWTSTDGSIIRKGKVGEGGKLFKVRELAALDSRIEEALKSQHSDFPYRQYYMSGTNTRKPKR